MIQVLNERGGWILLVVFGFTMSAIAYLVSRNHLRNREEFFVASRNLGTLQTAMSIAASWIWAPALFVAAQKAYEFGSAGLFWYCVPNFLTLVIFGTMALRLREKLPLGYTFPQFINREYGTGVHVLYLIQFYFLQVCCLAVQLVAGGILIESIAGIDFLKTVAFLTILTLTYSVFGGIRASVATDFTQMLVILAVISVAVPWTTYEVGIQQLYDGLGGINRQYYDVFNPWVVYSFGIPISIALLSGPIGDQMHWQRGFALQSNSIVRKTYVFGACIFIVVPFSLGILGFLAAGTQVVFTEPRMNQMVGPLMVANYLPAAMLVVFAIMILSGLCSTLDSVFCAVSSLTATDLMGRTTGSEHRDVLCGQFGMVTVAIVGLMIAVGAHSLQLRIEDLFIFYGTWRASTMIPTYVTLCYGTISSRFVFASITLSMMTGAPLIAYGKLFGNVHAEVAGSISVFVIGVLLCGIGIRKSVILKARQAYAALET